MNKLQTLYKRSKSGAIEEWDIFYGDGWYEVQFGQQYGAKQTKRNFTKPKNVGRANETTPAQQAEAEAISRWKKQIDKGYCQNLAEAETTTKLRPMLAHKLHEHEEKVVFPVFTQPKLNGLRCLAYWNSNDEIELMSRGCKTFSLPHLEEYLKTFLPKDVVLDGELYHHGTMLQTINSWIQKEQVDSLKIKMFVYDIVDPSKIFSDRFFGFTKNNPTMGPVVYVDSTLANSLKEIQSHHDYYKSLGFEGTIVRLNNSGYEIGMRAYQLLKKKDFVDEEFEVIGAEANENSPGECSVICVTKDGKQFKAKPEGSHEERCWYWDNREDIVGKLLTVRYFELTKDNKPQHGIGVCIRDYE